MFLQKLLLACYLNIEEKNIHILWQRDLNFSYLQNEPPSFIINQLFRIFIRIPYLILLFCFIVISTLETRSKFERQKNALYSNIPSDLSQLFRNLPKPGSVLFSCSLTPNPSLPGSMIGLKPLLSS